IADLRMVAAARQIRLAQALDETDAVVAKRGQLGEERAAVRVTVSAGARDLVLVPALELRVATREDDPDAATEAAALRLDQVAEHLLRAPLAGRRMPGEHALGGAGELGGQRARGGAQEVGDLGGRESSGVLHGLLLGYAVSVIVARQLTSR